MVFRPNRKTLDEIKAHLKQYNYVLVSTEYHHNKEKLETTCPKGHKYTVSFHDFQSGKRCSDCNGGIRLSTNKINQYIESEGYKWVSGEYKNVRSYLYLLCPKGHTYKTNWFTFYTMKRRCSDCFGVGQHTTAEIAELAKTRGYKLVGEYINNRTPIKLTCKNGHLWEPTWKDFWDKGYNCPDCKINEPETNLSELLESVSIKFAKHDTSVLGGLELDLYIPEHRLAIEYCGLYFHSEEKRGRACHIDKLDKCLKAGIRLVTIFEDEWLEKKEVVKSKILGILGKHQKVFARKCGLKEVDLKTAKQFINQNHLQGYAPSVKAWGLYYQNELVSCMTVGKHHRQNSKFKWVLNRFCNKLNTTIVGGASKLLKATKEYRPLVSFADLRWSEGNVYKKLGFELEETLPPDYSYIKCQKRYSKQSLKAKEKDLKRSKEFHRIWDCGKQRWILK